MAREEGFVAVAMVYEAVCVAERQHEKRYNDLAANIEAGRVFKRELSPWSGAAATAVTCTKASSAPEMCPACAHPQAHFELLGENW